MPETTESTPSFADLAGQIDSASAKGETVSPEAFTAKPIPEKPAEPTKPVEKPAEKPVEQPKPAKEESTTSKLMGKKKEVAKVEEKPAEKAEEKPIDWKSAPKEFRERHEKLLTEHKTVAQKQAELEKKYAEAEARIQEIQSKSGDTTKADLKLMEEYSAKMAAAEAKIRELDYASSKEYAGLRDEYQAKYNQRYIDAFNEVKDFQIPDKRDEEGNVLSSRPATEADLKLLLGKTVAEQRRLTRAMFGEDADVVNEHLAGLRNISKEAEFTLSGKLKEAKEQGELRTKEQNLAAEKQHQEYEGLLSKFKSEIETEFPDIYTAKDDPDAVKALETGKEFLNDFNSKVSTMTMQERAAYNAVAQQRIAAFPLLEHRMERLQSKYDEAMKELEAVRGADPGKGGGKPAPAAKTDDEPSFASFSAKFDE